MNAHSICLRFAILSIAALSVPAAWAADAAPAWPQANGPFSNFNPRQYGCSLVDDLANARAAWTCADADLGFAKGSASGYLNHLTDGTTHPGAASGLIVAEGKVFASSFKPIGEAWAENHVSIGPAVKSEKFAGEKATLIRRNSALDADDFTVAIDFETGKVAWRTVEKGRGINRYSGKRGHFGVTPAYHDGKVFSFGTAGTVYCYDAATGKKLWENADGALAKIMAQTKPQILVERKTMPGGGGMSASLVVADGVLIVPDHGASQRDVPLRGLDVETGKNLWTVPAATVCYATPAVWTHGGRQYIVSATVGVGASTSGALRMIDPKTGKVLWTLSDMVPTWYPLAVSEKHAFVNVPSKTINPKKSEQPWGLIGAYRLSPEKAELAWTMPDKPQFWFENHMDICAMRRLLVRDGKVYFAGQGHTLDPAKSSFFFSILDEQTGNPLYTSPPGLFGHGESGGIIGQYWLMEDRIFNMRDAAHSDTTTIELLSIDPANVRRLCTPWKPPHKNTTAYEVFIELPYVDGRFLMRAWDGSVRCYDLRANGS